MNNSTSSRRMGRSKRTHAQGKKTHKLTPQTCVVWVPASQGYAADFGPGALRVASHPEFAYHLTEDEAEDMAIALRVQLGIKASIRPYYAQVQG